MPSPPTPVAERSDAQVLAEQAGLRRMGATPSLRQYLRDIWDRREFMITVPLNELRAQNQNTVLGNLWHLLNPLFLAGVFYLVFGVILGIRGSVDNYAGFLVVGVLTFSFLQKAMMSGTRTIVSNLKLIQSLSFPRAVLPISSTISETVSQFPALLAMMVIVVLTGEPLQAEWVLLAPVLVIQAIFNLGVAFITARMTFHFRDTAQLLPYLTRIWLYLSGVFFTADLVAQRAGEGLALTLFEINPAQVFIRLNRIALLGPESREQAGLLGESTLTPFLVGTAWAVGVLVVGFWFFRRRESEYGRG